MNVKITRRGVMSSFKELVIDIWATSIGLIWILGAILLTGIVGAARSGSEVYIVIGSAYSNVTPLGRYWVALFTAFMISGLGLFVYLVCNAVKYYRQKQVEDRQ